MATPKKWVKATLFLSSYFPLWIIFLSLLLVSNSSVFEVQDTGDAGESIKTYLAANWLILFAAISLGFIAFFPLAILRKLIKETLSGTNPEKITIQGKEELTSEYMLYVVTYVFPFLTQNILDSLNGIALAGIMITIGILYVRANLFHVNPTLMLFNYRLFKVTDEHNTYYLLSRREQVFNNLTLRAFSMSGLIYIEKPYQPQDSTTFVSQ